jgi:hypothetical protein
MKNPSVAKMAKMAGDNRSAAKFNAGLRKASAEGKLDNNPKFKEAVDSAPMKLKKQAAMKKEHIKPGDHTTHGNPSKYTTASGKSVDSANIDEGNLSTVMDSPGGKKYVVVQEDTERFKAGTKLYINE